MFDDIFNRLDTIHERGGQTDGRTPADSKDSANALHHALKTTFAQERL